MKKSILIISALLLGTITFAQNKITGKSDAEYANHPYWQEMMLDRNISFFETQKAFYSWWENRVPDKGEGFSVFKRWEHYWESRVDENGFFPEAGKTERELKTFLQNNPQNKLKSGQAEWKELGPRDRTTPLGYMGIGRVNAIAFDPVDTAKIYVGAPAGGFWISEDSGENWITHTDPLPTLGVSAILVHPDDPNKILIGTGDRDGGNDWGVGCMLSLDGGLTWETKNSGMEERTVGMFAQNENDPNIVLAAANGGLYKTIDFGENWTKVSANEEHENFRDIKYKPGDPSVAYTSSNVGFYRSEDGGETWTLIGEEEGITATGRIVIGVSPANNNVVFLVIGGTFKGCFRSGNSGKNFTLQSDSPNILGGSFDGDDDRNQSWYDLVIHVDPFNANIVHTGGINLWRSDDAGVTWKCTGHWTGDRTNVVHADQHTIAYNYLNNRMYVGNDGGIYYTDDQGESYTDISVGLGIGQMYKLGVSATNREKYIAGFQDNGSATHTPEGWKTSGGGDGFECIVDPYSDQYSYTSVYYGNIMRHNDRGSSMHVAAEDAHGITESGAWVTPYRLSEWDANTMIIGYKNIWVCENIKSNTNLIWKKISDNLGGSNSSNCRVVETSPADSNLLYFARHDGKMFRTDNMLPNPTWIDLTDYKPHSGSPSDFEAHPYDPDIIYMTIGTKVFKSIDRGFIWENISGSIPELPVNNIEFDRSSNEGLYIGTDAGVYYKDADMDDWILFGNKLPASVEVSELEIYYDRFNRNDSRLRASTYGRGMWEIKLAEADNVILPPYLLLSFVTPYDVELSWSAPHFPNKVTGYNVYRNGEIIATTSSTFYLDRHVDRKIYNSYKVSAIYQSGEESAFTNTIDVLAPVSLPYEQNFESGVQGWNGKFSIDGWNFGSAEQLDIDGNDGLFWGINSAFAGTETHVKDYLTTPIIDLAEYEGQTITLEFDYTLRRFLRYDKLYVVYRESTEADWIILEELQPVKGSGWVWENKKIDLPEETIVDGMQLGFLYDDSDEHAWGAGIDNVVLSVNTTSIFNLELENMIEIFPNPNDGNFEIYLNLKKAGKIEISILDILGKEVYSDTVVSEGLEFKADVDLGNIAPGNYQVVIRSKENVYKSKIVIN